jgi:hypothetical protein
VPKGCRPATHHYRHRCKVFYRFSLFNIFQPCFQIVSNDQLISGTFKKSKTVKVPKLPHSKFGKHSQFVCSTLFPRQMVSIVSAVFTSILRQSFSDYPRKRKMWYPFLPGSFTVNRSFSPFWRDGFEKAWKRIIFEQFTFNLAKSCHSASLHDWVGYFNIANQNITLLMGKKWTIRRCLTPLSSLWLFFHYFFLFRLLLLSLWICLILAICQIVSFCESNK